MKETLDIMAYLGGLAFFVVLMISIVILALVFILSNKIEKIKADLDKDFEEMDRFYDGA